MRGNGFESDVGKRGDLDWRVGDGVGCFEKSWLLGMDVWFLIER